MYCRKSEGCSAILFETNEKDEEKDTERVWNSDMIL